MDALAGRVALIVGAGTGVSGVFARLRAATGARVALAARNSVKLATLCAQSGAPGVAVETDLSRAIDRVPGHLAQAGR